MTSSLHADVSATLQPGFVGATVPDWLVAAHGTGLTSVCLYGTNVTGSSGLGSLCVELRERLPGVLLAVDEEGGDVTRLHYPAGSPSVGNAVLGRIDDEATTSSAAARIGSELAASGIGLDLAPVVDINSSPENPVIGVRSFGDTTDRVSRHSAAWVAGLQGVGVAACAKHFPGHGDTSVDSHHGLPRITVPLGVLLERELAPFRAAVGAGVACVMTSHIIVDALDPDRPATFSPIVLRVLREDLGFQGVIVSDALDMAGASAVTGIPEAAVLALLAGVDLLCLGSQTPPERYAATHAAIVDAVESGRLPEQRVVDAASRVRALAARSTGHLGARPPENTPSPSASTPGSTTPVPAPGPGTSPVSTPWWPNPGSMAETERHPTVSTPWWPSREARQGDISDAQVEDGEISDAQVAATFTTSDAFARWVEDPASPVVVQVGTGSNLAVGAVSWGPLSVGVGLDPESVPSGAKVAVVGRSVSVDHPARQVVADLRAAGHHTVLVECGWPRGGADVETLGGSPAVARALVGLLGMEAPR